MILQATDRSVEQASWLSAQMRHDLNFRHSLLIEEWKQELRTLNLLLLLAFAKRILENQNQQA